MTEAISKASTTNCTRSRVSQLPMRSVSAQVAMGRV